MNPGSNGNQPALNIENDGDVVSLQQSAPLSKRRLILEVRWGLLAHHKVVIEPGQLLRVGRTGSAELALPHDDAMAEAHFEISWDGSHGWVRDLGSHTGTYLEGQREAQGEVFNGSWVRAGSTDFNVYFERTTPPLDSMTSHLPAQEHRGKTHALKLLCAQTSPLYAILDAARNARILELLRDSVEEYRSLYEGPQGDVLEEVAPYLIRLPRQSCLLEALVHEGWGSAWGVFFLCSQSLPDVRRHFRKLLMAEAEGSEGRLYFRFYDPRVLRMIFASSSSQQRSEFLGPIEHFIIEGESEGQSATVLTLP